MIGLSISFCVREIAAGKVALAEVEKIVAGTRVASWRKMKALIRCYLRAYWHENPTECERVMRQMVVNTKRAKRGRDPRGPVIEQPRLRKGGQPPLLVGPNGPTKWVESEAEIRYCKPTW